jgi:acetyl-CoA carboxylase biotin carboxyl carrier protein
VGGVLVRGERSFDLVTPANTRGQIASIPLANHWNDCEHGSRLAALVEMTAGAEATAGSADDAGSEGGFVLRSTTHGTFYRRPSPDAPLYVDSGQTIEAGATVGLVEVMKCFSPVTFTPPAASTRGTVEEVLVQDGAEVRADQPLLRLRLS